MFDEFILPDQQHISFAPISEFPNEKLRKTNVGVCPEKKIRLIIILCQDTEKKMKLKFSLHLTKILLLHQHCDVACILFL